MSNDRYQLIDFGSGRKLESVGGRIIDRPSPAAEGARRAKPNEWAMAESRFDTARKSWQHHTDWPNGLSVDCGGFRMPVRPTPFGHIGLFPEQARNWQWLRHPSALRHPSELAGDETAPPTALNLFGYTGASTIALVFGGFQVAHVDAAKPNVQAVRAAADLNNLSDPPIRYLVDDAAKFVAREKRRGNQYHTIVMDPPAYGHTPKGKTWRLERDLWMLLDDCVELLERGQFRILVTGHSPQVDSPDVSDYFHETLPQRMQISSAQFHIQSGRLQLSDASGRELDAGFFVRVESNCNS